MKEQSREICYITMVMMELMVKVFQIFLIGHDSGFVAVKMVMMTSGAERFLGVLSALFLKLSTSLQLFLP